MTMEGMWNMKASSTTSTAQPGFSATNQLNVDAKQLSQACMAKEMCLIDRTFRQEPGPDRLRSELLAMVSESQQHLTRSTPYAASYCQAWSPDHGGWPMPSPFIPPQANRSVQGRSFRSHDNFPVNGSRGAQELGSEGNWHFPSSQWQRQQKSTLNSEACRGPALNKLNSGLGLMSQAQSGDLRVYCINYFGVPVVGQLGLSDAGRLGVACACHGQHMSVANFTQHSGLNAANPGEVVYMEGGETLVQWRKSFFSQYGVKVPEDSVGWEWLDFSAAEAVKYVPQSLQKEENVCGPLSIGNVLKEAVLKRYRGASMTSELGSSMSGQLCIHEDLSRRTFQSMSYSSGHQSVHSSHHFVNDGGQRYSWAGAEQVSSVPRSGNHAASRLGEPGQKSNNNASSFQSTQVAGSSMTTSSSVEHLKSSLFQQIMNKVWDGKLQHNVQQFNLPKVSGTTDQCLRTNRVDSCDLEDEQRSGFQSPSHSSQAGHKPESGVSEFHGKLDSTRSEDRQLQKERMAAKLETGTTLESLSAGVLVHLRNKARQRLLETALQSAFSYRALGLQGPSSRVRAEGLSGNLDVHARFPEFLVREQGQKQDPNQMRGLRTSLLQQQPHPVKDTSGREPQWQNSIIDRNGREEQQEKVRGWLQRDVMINAGLELKVHDALISRMQDLVDRESNEGRTVRGVDQEAITARASVEVAPLTGGGDIMPCGCVQCRKASSQVVPRLAVHACLNEKEVLSSSVEAAKNVEHVTEKIGAHVEQPDSVAAVEMEGVTLRRRNVETLACEGMEAAEECDQAIPDSGATAVRGEAMIPEVDVCSNSSENVSSGLSDEGCAVSGDGGSAMVQGSGILRDAGVVDEGSGIGKCWSSDDVDIGVGRNSNRLEDPSTVVGSPPSSSNMGKTRLVVKRRRKRVSQSIEGEAELVASTGKMERKQGRNMKWKWLGPGAESGVAKEGSPASSFGQVAETQMTSEDARIRSKVQERLDALKRDFRTLSGEMVAPSKRRKLLIYQNVKATNVTEENLEAANLDLKRKAGTLVIRVPEGVNQQKTKKGMRTKLWRSSLEEDGGNGPNDAGKLMPPRPVGRPTKAFSAVVRAVGSGSSFVTKNTRSPRTPLAGLSPRNGRIVSLSAILNQPVEARAVESRQKLRDGVARLRTEGASVLEFTEDEDVAASRPGKHATASAGVQTDRPKACPFPQGERSARPVKRSGAFGDAGKTPIGAWTYECQVSQVRSAAGSSISKEKLQQGFSFPMTKQVRSSCKVKRSGGVEEKSVRELGAVKQVHVKAGIALLKRKPDLCMAGVSAKRPRVVLAVKKAKEIVVCEVGETDELFKSSSRESTVKTKKLVGDSSGSGTRIEKKENSHMLDVSGSRWRKERVAKGIIQSKKLGPAEKCICDVCGTFSSASYNKLLCCCRCPVKVHQACYGVPKVPKSPWMCRTCKFKVSNPICVLCGYGGGAMTRVQKSRPFCLALLQIWRDLRNESARETYLNNDDNETLLSATNHIRMKPHTMKMKRDESRDCEDHTRDNKSVCKVCRKESPEPGSTSAGNHEDWRRHNTVGAIVKDVGAKQWAHMVCTLWMPGTRCLNMGTMGMFDVSGVTASRRKALCSICQRKGGACIQCRVPKCSTPFHVWCAHEKGLLQSEIVQDGSNQVGFFGKCQSHGMCSSSEAEEDMQDGGLCSSGGGVCARTEGYKGRLSLEERATAQQQMTLEGGTAVTPEQVAAWLRISNRKMTALRRGVYKSANSGLKFDHREYLRFKQKKGWRKLAIYKSAIHALGLYTSDFIGEGEMVVEYVGEIVGLRVADKREAEYQSGKRLQHQGACYLFRIDADQIIDATRKGGIARFVNHSCSPNCVAKVICVDNLKKVIFFAKRHIHAGEEVTYDYKFNYDELDDKIPCFCGTPKCRGTLN